MRELLFLRNTAVVFSNQVKILPFIESIFKRDKKKKQAFHPVFILNCCVVSRILIIPDIHRRRPLASACFD